MQDSSGSRYITKGVSTLRSIRSPGCGESMFPFSESGTSYWFSGQAALWQGIRSLGLVKGCRVLVPAYSCGDEIDVLAAAGVDIHFYGIQRNLMPDMDHLASLCATPASALYVTHYFGFPQPLEQLRPFARQHGMLLIEDNAHGLFSMDQQGNWLGSAADLSIFSLHKKLPIPDGGALLLREGQGPAQRNGSRPPLTYLLRSAARILLQEIMYRLPKGAYRFFLKKKADREAVEAQVRSAPGFLLSRRGWGMSTLSARIVRRLDFGMIRERRVRNYRIIDDAFIDGPNGHRLFAEMPEGCCPWFYPVISEKPDMLVAYLRDRDIWASRFWANAHPAIPAEEFAWETLLRERVVVLPIHQEIDERQARYIARQLNAWSSAAQERSRAG